MKIRASVVPARKRIQNHGANLAPATTAAPTTITQGKAISPRIGLGRTKTAACAELRREPQESSELQVQEGRQAGSSGVADVCISSTVAKRQRAAPRTTRREPAKA